jgi:hypothetical protein
VSEFLTRETARSRALFEIEIGDAKFQCRVPASLELLADGVLIYPIVDPTLGLDEFQKRVLEASRKVEENLRTNTDIGNALFARMMVKPKLWLGPEEQCPEDQVTPMILGPYRDALMNACMPHIGYGEDRRKAVDFCDPVGDGAVAPADVEVVG